MADRAQQNRATGSVIMTAWPAEMKAVGKTKQNFGLLRSTFETVSILFSFSRSRNQSSNDCLVKIS